MIVFFATNRNLKRYFGKLKAGFNERARVYSTSKLSLPKISALSRLSDDFIDQHVDIAQKQFVGKTGQLPSAYWVFVKRFSIRWYYAVDTARLEKLKPTMVVVWNGLMLRRAVFVQAAKDLGIKSVFMENGLLPNTTVLDRKGINALNSVPRDAAFYLNRTINSQYEAKAELVVRKGRVEKKASGKPLPERYIFIPFQVDYDSQILLFSPWVSSMDQLFNVIIELAQSFPDYHFVLKEHPSSNRQYPHLHAQASDQVFFANEYATQTLIENAQAVITINSTVGIEALLFAKKVITLGEAFYAIEDLVLSARSVNELQHCVDRVDDFMLNESLRLSFLDYLENEYLIKGSWKNAESEHCQIVKERLLLMLEL